MLLAFPALARDDSSLGDLSISASRVPDWWPVDPIDTSTWETVNATIEGGTLGCSNVVVNDSKSDAAGLQCMIDAAEGSNTVVQLPAGQYELMDGQGLQMKSGVVLAGAGTSSILNLAGRAKFASNSCKSLSWVNFNGSNGTSTPWTGGYARGTTVLEVSDASAFSPGDWVTTHMNPDMSKLTRVGSGSAPHTNHWEYTVRVKTVNTSSSPNTVTIDRPLRLDYTASGGRTVTKLNPITGAGLQNMRIRYRNSVHGGSHVICLKGATANSVRDIEFDGFAGKAVFLYSRTARNLVFRNSMHGSTNETSAYPVNMVFGASDNHIHMNYFESESNAITIQQGAVGNLITYNYAGSGRDHKRLVFFHGEYPSENLMEGNELDATHFDIDNWYGIQGPRNTFFRNRATDERISGTKPFAFRTHMDKADTQIGEMPNLLLNFGAAFYQPVGCKNTPAQGGSYEDGVCEFWDWDPANHASAGNLWTVPWAERNIGIDTRSSADCTADNEPYLCCTGPSTPADNCAFGASFSSNFTTGNVENYNRTDPYPGWFGDSYPYSLVTGWNDSKVRPLGWCAEIAEWPVMGADVDSTPTANLPKSPAHRLSDGDTCTTSEGSDGGSESAGSGVVEPPLPGVLEPPFLLP